MKTEMILVLVYKSPVSPHTRSVHVNTGKVIIPSTQNTAEQRRSNSDDEKLRTSTFQ